MKNMMCGLTIFLPHIMRQTGECTISTLKMKITYPNNLRKVIMVSTQIPPLYSLINGLASPVMTGIELIILLSLRLSNKMIEIN